ncbi:MAG: hypothetical protein AMS17_00035 [Spirochaetes bacterium DG_61]|jgi:uncharacterized protein (TIGR00725 family)|nr:MAG: hypothetical protein AMS17_00035 [Spirochaetes bacterium DG_61]
MRTLIGVIGSSKAVEPVLTAAYSLGREIIRAGYSLICGGLGGVMEEVCRGAHDEAGSGSGRIIGLLPGTQKGEANPYVDIVIPTGMGYARNMIIACSSDALIAVSGESGTLSEIAMAWNYGKPVVAMAGLPGITAKLIGGSLDIQKGPRKIEGAKDAKEAIELVKRLLSL